MDNTEIIIVPANYLFAISLYQGNKDVRYYLNGIAIFPFSQHVVGTDGHTLCVGKFDAEKFWWNNPTGSDGSGKIREPHWIMGNANGDSKPLALKKPKAKEHWAVIKINPDTQQGQIQYCEYENRDFVIEAVKENNLPATQVFSFKLIDGIYPQYNKIRPDYSAPIKDTMVIINADYLQRIGNTAKALSNEKFIPVGIHYPITNKCCTEVEIAGVPDLQIIFMQVEEKSRFTEKAILPTIENYKKLEKSA